MSPKRFAPRQEKLHANSSAPQKPVVKPTPKPKPKPKYKIYKVKSGDTLSEIAEKYHVPLSKLKKANNLRSDKISIGQSLKIPK